MWYNALLENDRIPDVLIRFQIRKLLAQRLKDENKGSAEANQENLMRLISDLKKDKVATDTQTANGQHYELPAAFFGYCLGEHMKYSSGYWKPGVTDINTSERDMLELTCTRAGLKEGQDVLELGCGWGSLSLFMSKRYPGSRFTVISNSGSQKEYIDKRAKERGITNLRVVTADINVFETEERFDRVVSVEMFEHMRNYERLLSKVSSFLKEDGKLFVHIFTHKDFAYKFEVKDESDWMSKYFFTGGIMPSDHLLLYFNACFSVEQHWRLNGNHYAKTSEAWLRNMDNHKKEIMPVLRSCYGESNAVKWWVYWRIFYMSCAELWAYKNGEEWMVSHYLFCKKNLPDVR